MMLINPFMVSPNESYELWFKFDDNLNNSGTLTDYTVGNYNGDYTFSSSNANSGKSFVPNNTLIMKFSGANYPLGSNFYVSFYATWPNPSSVDTRIIESTSGFTIRKLTDGKIRVSTELDGTLFTTSLSYNDGIMRKFKVSFVAGAVTLYVNDVAVNTATSVITEYLLDRSALLILVFAQSGYYDDLIIQRN